MSTPSGTFVSDLSHKVFPLSDRVYGKNVRASVMEMIRRDHHSFGPGKTLSLEELNHYRQKYLESFLEKQIGRLSELDRTVLESMKDKTTITGLLDGDEPTAGTFGQRIADKVADFGGSWTFIIAFAIFLVLWMIVNTVWLVNRAFDPYPFILLNLILSSIAAIQAPVIMMSQNRQEEKDRERARRDYMINLKSELEIRMLHEKIDHLMLNGQENVEDQQIETP